MAGSGLLNAGDDDPVYDVIIVGCGPVGAFTAALLNNYGLATLCLERDVGVYAAPRAVAMDDEIVRLVGLAHPSLTQWLDNHTLKCPFEVRSGCPPLPHGLTDQQPKPLSERVGEMLGVGSYSLVGPAHPHLVPRSGFHDTVFFHQPSLEAVMRDEAFLSENSTATLYTRVEATAVRHLDVAGGVVDVDRLTASPATSPTAGPSTSSIPSPQLDASSKTTTSIVEVDTRDTADGSSKTFKCRYLLGCDGGSSFIRKSMKIGFDGDSFADQPWIVIDAETEDPAIAERWQYFNFIADPRRPFVHCPLPGSRSGRRFEFILNRGENPDAMLSAESVDKLLRSIDVNPSSVRIIRTVVYSFHARQASPWRKGRVMLLGDAAHCMPPFRGQGMCAGIRDAANVCWKVASAVAIEKHLERLTSAATVSADADGWLGSFSQRLSANDVSAALASFGSLLDSYQQERQSHLRAVIAITIEMGRLIMLRNRLLAWVRNVGLASLDRFPLTSAWVKRPFTPPVGYSSGCFDFYDHHGHRSWVMAQHASFAGPKSHSRASSVPSGSSAPAPEHDGWTTRNDETGVPVPNFPVVALHSGAAFKALLTSSSALNGRFLNGNTDVVDVALIAASAANMRLDVALWHASQRQQLLQNLRAHTRVDSDGSSVSLWAPSWYILIATSASSLPAAHHPMALLSERVRSSMLGPSQQQGASSQYVVVQCLPACGGPVRMARHQAWRSSHEDVADASADAASPAKMEARDGNGLSTTGNDDAGDALLTTADLASPANPSAEVDPEPWFGLAHASFCDPTAQIREYFERSGAAIAVIRPDHFVYGLYTTEEWPFAADHLVSLLAIGPLGPPGVGLGLGLGSGGASVTGVSPKGRRTRRQLSRSNTSLFNNASITSVRPSSALIYARRFVFRPVTAVLTFILVISTATIALLVTGCALKSELANLQLQRSSLLAVGLYLQPLAQRYCSTSSFTDRFQTPDLSAALTDVYSALGVVSGYSRDGAASWGALSATRLDSDGSDASTSGAISSPPEAGTGAAAVAHCAPCLEPTCLPCHCACLDRISDLNSDGGAAMENAAACIPFTSTVTVTATHTVAATVTATATATVTSTATATVTVTRESVATVTTTTKVTSTVTATETVTVTAPPTPTPLSAPPPASVSGSSLLSMLFGSDEIPFWMMVVMGFIAITIGKSYIRATNK